jgi:hypothetical protein
MFKWLRGGNASRRVGVIESVQLDGKRSVILVRRDNVGEGELAVRRAFADAILIRPAVMVGPNDAFLTTILKLLNRLPFFRCSGMGRCDYSHSM